MCMHTRFLLFGIMLLALSAGVARATKTVRGSGKVITEEREVRDLERVSVAGSGRLIIAQGDEESLRVEAEDNLAPLVTTEVVNHELRIGFKSNVSVSPTKPIVFRLAVKRLSSIDISGSATIEAKRLEADALSVEIGGSGNVNLSVYAKTVSSEISGSGKIVLAGIANKEVVTIGGSGDYVSTALKTKSCQIRIGGSGKARVNATEVLDVNISGSGKVYYAGDPAVTANISGSGSLKKIAQ